MSEILERDRHERGYARSEADVVQAIGRVVLDTDYHANGYTTRAQADRLGDVLDLAPGRVLVDVGSGGGWPGLYLARRHGCSVIAIDPVVTGVQTAHRRIVDDAMTGRAWAVAGTAAALPVRPASVDAVVHTDVMC
ncbi:MAG: methyltransferase domain-containing protein [Acidimicrobiia bacterium]|nr:methyltransferase domain-containing protein [Acidimicrobiia bacterium]